MSTEVIEDGKQYTDASYSIFDPIIKDDSNIEYNYVKIDPTIGANLTSKNSQGDAIEYQYYGKDVYQLSKSYFLMKAIYHSADDNLVYADARNSSDITPINNLAHEAFNDGTLWMGNEEAEKTTNIGHADTICKLVYASSEWGSGQGSDSGWFTDTTNSGVGGDAAGIALADNYRASEPAKLRRERVSGTYAATLNAVQATPSYFMVKPPFGLLTGNQGVFKDVSFRIKLNRQGNNFLGVAGHVGAAGPGGKLVILEMPLYLCVRKPNLDILFQLEKQLANSVIRYQYTTIKTNSIPIAYRATNLNVNLNSYPAKPAAVLLAFQNDNRETIYSDYGQFDHYDISELSLRVNDKRLPYEVMRTDFPNRIYQEPLTYLREMVGHNNYIKGHMITNKNFASNYPIFAFNLRNNNEGIPEPNKINTRLDLNVTFSPIAPAVTPSGKVHCIFLFDNVMEVTGTSNVVKKVYGA